MLERLQAERDLRVLMDGSPNFFHTFGAIVAGSNEYIEVATTFPRARGFQPLQSLVVTNNSGEFVDLAINGRPEARIPAGVIMTIPNTPIWSFRLTNNDSTNVAAGEITANISTPPLGADQAARMNLTRQLSGGKW